MIKTWVRTTGHQVKDEDRSRVRERACVTEINVWTMDKTRS